MAERSARVGARGCAASCASGKLFIYGAHPAAPLWTRDTDEACLDPRRSYFGETRADDTFPASAIARFGGDGIEAIEWQWTLAEIVSSVSLQE